MPIFALRLEFRRGAVPSRIWVKWHHVGRGGLYLYDIQLYIYNTCTLFSFILRTLHATSACKYITYVTFIYIPYTNTYLLRLSMGKGLPIKEALELLSWRLFCNIWTLKLVFRILKFHLNWKLWCYIIGKSIASLKVSLIKLRTSLI